jgi:sulfhydrogenase subunit beta (sulfur reductase)
MSDAITRESLRQLVAGWLAAGTKVIGPVQVKPGKAWFEPLESAGDLLLDGWVRPANSIKEAVFPRHESLYGYRIEKNAIELVDPVAEIPAQIVIGAHPCDAASLPILDKIFNWDSRDEFYNRRRAATTVISIACTAHDDRCFCTTVGLAPDAERGSDILLFERGDGTLAVRSITEKGRALMPGKEEEGPPVTAPAVAPKAAPAVAPTVARADASTTTPTDAPTAASPPVKFDPAEIAAFARSRFDDPFWAVQSLACLGCGACAYTCPVCHCFDIADEGNAREGARVRNWDACQFPLFTQHATGHNPRRAQGDRQRQRIYHKFVVYPDKFGETLCTGCGNCARNCPEGLGVLPLVTGISYAKSV